MTESKNPFAKMQMYNLGESAENHMPPPFDNNTILESVLSASHSISKPGTSTAIAVSNRLYALNGGDAESMFELYSESYSAAREAHACVFRGLKKEFPQFKRIKTTKALANAALGAMESLHSTQVMDIELKFESALSESLGHTDISVEQSDLFGSDGIFALPSRLRQTNISQYAREVAESRHGEILGLIETATRRLNALCLANGYSFSLRPLSGFSGGRIGDQLKLSPTVDIPAGLYYSTSALAVRNTLMRHLPSHNQYLLSASMKDFLFYYNRIATAVLTCGTNIEYALVPLGLPPLLYSFSDSKLPIYLESPRQTHLPMDQIVKLIHLETVDITPDHLIQAAQYQPPAVTECVNLLSSIAALLSIAAAVVAVGRGRSRPSWVQSPLNHYQVLTSIDAAKIAIKRAQQ